ncbi:MAG: hypothetical protein EOO77_02665 [Oxalobacteraceae bacterium]|nr:MAG: hypothetical protein EOO77_02665 [Oxalobacteraceae bacterium]
MANNIGGTMLAGAIKAIGSADDRIVNTGSATMQSRAAARSKVMPCSARVPTASSNAPIRCWSALSMRAKAMTA